MFPFNIINWVKLVLLSGVMSVLLGGVILGIRWNYWIPEWIPHFQQDNDKNLAPLFFYCRQNHNKPKTFRFLDKNIELDFRTTLNESKIDSFILLIFNYFLFSADP